MVLIQDLITEEVLLMSAEMLFAKIEKIMINEPMKFRQITEKHMNKLFWNLIYYFQEHELPFDFLLFYQDTDAFDKQFANFTKYSTQRKITRNPNDQDEVIIGPN